MPSVHVEIRVGNGSSEVHVIEEEDTYTQESLSSAMPTLNTLVERASARARQGCRDTPFDS